MYVQRTGYVLKDIKSAEADSRLIIPLFRFADFLGNGSWEYLHRSL